MRRIRTFLIFAILFRAAAALFAEEPGNPQNQLALKEGLNYFYNSEFRDADKKFGEYIALEPDDPAGYWRKVYNLYFEARSVQKTDAPKFSDKGAEFIALINKGLGKADAKIAKGDKVDFDIYVKACLYSIKGIIEYQNVSMFTARNSMIESVSFARQSQYQDAKYLLGLINYKTSKHRWFAQKLSGLPGNRDEGLVMIFAAAAQNTGAFADDVWFAVWNIETDRDNAGTYSKATVQSLFDYLFAKYPHNENLQEYVKSMNRK